MSDLKISKLLPEEIPEVLKLLRITIQKAYSFIPDKEFDSFFNFLYSENILKRYLQNQDDDLYVARINSKVIGFLHAGFDIGDLYCAIHACYIHPEYQNRGIGSKMASIIIKKVRDLQFHRVHLGVFVDNSETWKLYQRLGFTKTSSRIEKIGDQQFEHVDGYFEVPKIINFLEQKDSKIWEDL